MTCALKSRRLLNLHTRSANILLETLLRLQLLHGHIRYNRPGLALNDTFHDVLNMIAARRDRPLVGLHLSIGISGEKDCILPAI